MMISTILLILKIIGIVLLSIIGFLLFLILLILFWPYHYSIKGSKYESMYAGFNLSFFFHFISAWVLYDKEFNIIVKILGIPLFDYKKRKAKSDAEENSLDNDLDKDIDKDILTDFDSFDSIDDTKESQAETIKSSVDKTEIVKTFAEQSDVTRTEEELIETIEVVDSKSEDSEDKSKDNDKDKDDSRSIFDKISDFISGLIKKIETLVIKVSDAIIHFTENTTEKVNKIVDTIAYYDNLFHKKGTEWVINYVKVKIIKLCKALKPYSARVYLDYGSEDPAKVGKMFELYSMLSPFLPKKSKFNADYENEHMNFEVQFKGYFELFYIAIIALQLVLNKKVKKFIKLLKRED